MMGRVHELWDAPTAARPLDARVSVPGSKSLTNRALVVAALAGGPTTLRRPLVARDTCLMVDALRALGIGVDDHGPDRDWQVTPAPLRAPAEVDCGLAGTVMRFVPPVAALAPGPVRLDGDPRARERPLGALLDALRSLGVEVRDGGGGLLPVTVVGTGRVRGGTVDVDAGASSQFVSALLLAGCRYEEGLVVRDVGARLPSRPHVAMTTAMLTARGVAVQQPDEQTWLVPPAVPAGGTVEVEPDASNALPFLAAALATAGRVGVTGFPSGSGLQPVGALRELLEAFGGSVSQDDGALVVDGSGGLRGAGDLDLSEVGELVPVVAALAALAPGPTTLHGVAHLRGHETDRLAALATELGGLGADIRQTDDGLAIRPARLHGGVFATYDDHRLATAAALVGLAVPGVQVVDVATTGKTLPDFVERWQRMLAA